MTAYDRLGLQVAEGLLTTVYKNFQIVIAQEAGSSSGSVTSLTDKGSTSTSVVLVVTPGCGRDDSGYARLEFAISAENITKEEAGVEARRKLQSTPCSATDGATVSSCPMHCLSSTLFLMGLHDYVFVTSLPVHR